MLRQLKRYEKEGYNELNASLVAYLYYACYMLEGERDTAEKWKNKVSLLNLKLTNKLLTNAQIK